MSISQDEQQAWSAFAGQSNHPTTCVSCGSEHQSGEFTCDDCDERVMHELGCAVAGHMPGSVIGGQVPRNSDHGDHSFSMALQRERSDRLELEIRARALDTEYRAIFGDGPFDSMDRMLRALSRMRRSGDSAPRAFT